MSKITFNNKNRPFFNALNKKVEEYFSANGIRPTGNFQLHLKTVILLTSLAAFYVIMLMSSSILVSLAAASLIGVVMAGIGFNVMHDSAHGSYSRSKTVNNILSHSMNLMGSPVYVWKTKHNIVHHTYTNIEGADDDIAKSPFFRFCELQERKPMHKFQYLYWAPLYAISSVYWMLVADFQKYFGGKIMTYSIPEMNTREKIIFWVTKIFLVVVQFAIPMYILGPGWGILCFFTAHAVLGLVLSIVFQLAHVVEHTHFSSAVDGKIEKEWAIHQIETTSNFGMTNPILTWFVGGLNFQVEHHLFPKISHVHYPNLSKIVKQTCEEFNVEYKSFPSFRSAVASHIRTLKRLGVAEEKEAAMA